jgi:hypothetical protein
MTGRQLSLDADQSENIARLVNIPWYRDANKEAQLEKNVI